VSRELSYAGKTMLGCLHNQRERPLYVH
jgi:hypothetical protein